MADFTRFISYLYDYRDGERNRNLGFAKVDSRQGMCRLTVCLNHGQVLPQKLWVCGYTDGDEGVSLVRLGEMDKGTRERQWRFPAQKLGGHEVNLENLAGLILLSEDRREFLLSVWNDGQLTAEEIRRGTFFEKPQKRELIEPEEQETNEPEETEMNEPEEPEVGALKVSDELVLDAAELMRTQEANRGKSVSEEHRADVGEAAMVKLLQEKATASDSWHQLCKLFPAAKPFEPSAWEVLCISLQDIGRLPPENWVWGNNHFVLHGFYQYRHLILARQRVENRIYLGVPGEFGVNEKFMAAMFGLHRFERERKGKSEMGYWLAPVNLNQL